MGDAETGERGFAQGVALVGFEAALHAHRHVAALAVGEAPGAFGGGAAAQEQAVVSGEIFRGLRDATAAEVVGRGAEHATIGGQAPRDEARIRERTDADREVHAGRYEVDELIAEVDVEVEAGMLREEAGQEWREVQAPEGGRDADAEGAADLAARLAHAVGQAGERFDRGAALLGEPGALAGGLEAAGGAMEEAHTELALEAFEALAGDGDRQPRATRGRADRAGIEHAQEQAQVGELVHIINDPLKVSMQPSRWSRAAKRLCLRLWATQWRS